MSPVNESNKKQFAENLRKVREEKGMTQDQVAKAAGMNTNYYAVIERGEVNPTFETIEIIVKALKIRSSDILPF